LVARAASLGLEVVAITDHDTTDGLPAAQAEAQRWGITAVPGVEISTLSGREEIHLLGYFVDPGDAELRAVLARSREARWQRAQKMVARLAELGMPVAWDRLVALAGEGSVVGRPHVVMCLLEAGHVSSWGEAFEHWIGRDCPAYVERYKLGPEEAIRLVRRSGGLPVLAHPYIYGRNGKKRKEMDLKHWLPRLKREGLAGLEVYYPNYPARVRRRLLALAARQGLAISGGSDFHGGPIGGGLGQVVVPWAAWEGLARRHRLERAAVLYPTGSEAPGCDSRAERR
jgi:predicted metal-dependent phosphoesterase TrpH